MVNFKIKTSLLLGVSLFVVSVSHGAMAQDLTSDVGAEDTSYSGQYYDASPAGASIATGVSNSPRQVDPVTRPGSRYVVVREAAGPDSVAARLVSGQRALKLGRYGAALEIYQQLYKKDAQNPHILMGLAVSQQQNGFNESAVATYEELLQLDPNNTDAMTNMLGLLKTQYPEVAYRKLRDLWERNPQNSGLAAQLGIVSASIGNSDDALRYLEVASSIEPNNASYFYNMAVISDRAGDYTDAVGFYQKALELDITYYDGRSIPREEVYDRLSTLRRL